MKKIVVANWKMHPDAPAQALEILARVDAWLEGLGDRVPPDIVVCPPFVFLDEVAAALGEGRLRDAAALGAQDVAAPSASGQTGEVSAAQLRGSGVRYAIIGHSERRAAGETDAVVAQKLGVALRNDLVPILCVGERSRDHRWQDELTWQVRASTAGMDARALARTTVAYEPVWAISTNPGARPDTPESAAESAALIRSSLGDGPRMLYGGSVTAPNAAGFLSLFDGVLVGGASLRPEFTDILAAAL